MISDELQHFIIIDCAGASVMFKLSKIQVQHY